MGKIGQLDWPTPPHIFMGAHLNKRKTRYQLLLVDFAADMSMLSITPLALMRHSMIPYHTVYYTAVLNIQLYSKHAHLK